MPERRTARAHAKANLVLEVLGLRPDGYHEIDTVLQELEMADVVTVAPAREWSIEVTGPRAVGTPGDDSNLALRAARLLSLRCGAGAAAICLEKHIPAAGGLGGGASDAATTLKLLQTLWDATDADVASVAAEVGSDEPFFLVGGTARARGRGERVETLPALPPHEVVLFVPRDTIERKTARMFAALDGHPFDSGSVVGQFVAERPQRVESVAVFNAFERVAFELFPWLSALWADLERRTGEAVRLAGAGPCLFWIGPSGGERVAAAATGAACDVILTKTVTR